jgi:hypothetical protein
MIRIQVGVDLLIISPKRNLVQTKSRKNIIAKPDSKENQVNAKSGMKTMKKIEPVGTEIPKVGTGEYGKYRKSMKDMVGLNMFKRAIDIRREAETRKMTSEMLNGKKGKKVNPEVVEELKKQSIECGYGIEAESRYGRGINNEKRST